MLQDRTVNSHDNEQTYSQLWEKCERQEALIAKLQKERNGNGNRAPFSNLAYDYLTNLQYKVKSLTAQLNAIKSGQKYTDMAASHKTQLAEKDREIKKLKIELGDANCRTVTVRKYFQQVIEDMEDENKKALAKKCHEIKVLENELLETQIRLDSEKDKVTEKNRELYQVKTELEEERDKNMALKAQINRDYENSSTPSSAKPKKKIITNNRVRTGKSPGGQPGHEGHLRKRHTPTNRVYIPAPEKYVDSPYYRPTGKTIVKQMVNIRLELIVDEYITPEFYKVSTGQRVHAEFPDGLVNDVNYGGSIKAFNFLINNYCNVSIKKASDFLFELTGGELRISTGMINKLSKEFSQKTEADQKKAFAEMLLSPVINVDFTSSRVNGQNMNVCVCATPKAVLYFAKEHKGHEGIQGTPIKNYHGTLVHDHDKTFYSYGDRHQECLEHPLRYLVASMQNEPGLKWNRQMHTHIQEMIHFKNSLDPDDDRDPDQINPGRVEALEKRYDEILELAKEEYEYEPPSKYNKDGFNLYKKLFDYRDNHLLFLHDKKIPPTNNLAEASLRPFKRKQHQVMVFRSWDGLDDLCDSMGTIASLRAQNKNLYESVASIFDRMHFRC